MLGVTLVVLICLPYIQLENLNVSFTAVALTGNFWDHYKTCWEVNKTSCFRVITLLVGLPFRISEDRGVFNPAEHLC